jgi:diacylglycerol kinase (ATP)
LRIDLIINPGSAEAVQRLRSEVVRLRKEGQRVEPRLTFERGDAWRFAREAAESGSELVIAAGGDGTINEVANGVHEVMTAAQPRGGGDPVAPRLGVIPLGTANDLARNLGIPLDLESAWAAALRGRSRRVNVGRVNERCFLNVSTGGFGAEATVAAPAGAKRALGTLAYLVEGIKRFAALEPSRARFVAGEVLFEGAFLLFAVGNSRGTGGGTEITPRASVEDGLLDVCIVKEISRVDFLGLLPDLRAGDHLDHPAVIYRQLRELRVEAEAELQVNADGEPMRDRAFRYSLSPHSLRVMVPQPPVAAPMR